MVKGFSQGNSISSQEVNAGDLHLANYNHTVQVCVRCTSSHKTTKQLKHSHVLLLCLQPNPACMLGCLNIQAHRTTRAHTWSQIHSEEYKREAQQAS